MLRLFHYPEAVRANRCVNNNNSCVRALNEVSTKTAGENDRQQALRTTYHTAKVAATAAQLCRNEAVIACQDYILLSTGPCK